MPIPTVWIVTRRPKKAFVGVAGGLKGAEDLAAQDAAVQAADAGILPESITTWSEHGEPPEPGKKFTRASVHVASRAVPAWTLTYDCIVHAIYQRPTPKKTPRAKRAAVVEPERKPCTGCPGTGRAGLGDCTVCQGRGYLIDEPELQEVG